MASNTIKAKGVPKLECTWQDAEELLISLCAKAIFKLLMTSLNKQAQYQLHSLTQKSLRR